MDKELRTIARLLDGIHDEFCELSEALTDIDKAKVVYVKADDEPEECNECCDCEDCFSL